VQAQPHILSLESLPLPLCGVEASFKAPVDQKPQPFALSSSLTLWLGGESIGLLWIGQKMKGHQGSQVRIAHHGDGMLGMGVLCVLQHFPNLFDISL
jgi:hypothetical protein